MAGEIKSLLIGLFIVSAIVTGLSVFSTELFDNYGVTGGDDIASLSAMEDVQEHTDAIRDKVQNIGTDSLLDTSYIILTGGLDVLVYTLSSVNIVVNMVTDAISMIGIPLPSWFIAMLLGMISITMLLAVFSAAWKTQV